MRSGSSSDLTLAVINSENASMGLLLNLTEYLSYNFISSEGFIPSLRHTSIDLGLQ